MNMLRLAAVLMVATASTLACSDDDDGSPTSVAGSPAEGGAASGTAGATAAGGEGSEGGAPSCVNQFDSSEGGQPAGGGEGGAEPDALEIRGHYVDNFGFDVDIGDKLWNGSGIIEYDNEQNVVYTQYPCDDAFNPNKFAKIVYTEPERGSFYYCMIEYSAESLDAAKLSEKVADESALDTDGCGGFAWSKAASE